MQRLVRALIIVAVLGAIAVMVALLPPGYDADLSSIGEGQAAVVLVHDPNVVQSGNLMHALDRVRGDFDTVRFLVADQNLREGMAFAESRGLRVATLALYSPDGRLMDVYTGGPEPERIRAWIAERVP